MNGAGQDKALLGLHGLFGLVQPTVNYEYVMITNLPTEKMDVAKHVKIA